MFVGFGRVWLLTVFNLFYFKFLKFYVYIETRFQHVAQAGLDLLGLPKL